MHDLHVPRSWDLTGKVALVTGSARGIGHATAKLLWQRGASVIASDLSEDVHALAEDGLVTVIGDISCEDTAQGSVALAIESFGRLDILVNNAGRTLNKPLLDTSQGDLQAILDVNVTGTFLHSREAIRTMLTSGGGTIVNMTSIVARVAMKDTAAYAASKGAIAQLTKEIGVEYGDRGIRANALAPGVVETDILEGIVDDSRATLASHASAHPLGRVGQPQDIAEIAAFLASPASSFMTGALVMADGGYTAL